MGRIQEWDLLNCPNMARKRTQMTIKNRRTRIAMAQFGAYFELHR
jgi:hypothetical protein